MHLKLRVILTIGLITVLLAAPALAYRDYPMDVTYSLDNNGQPRKAAVHFQDVSENDYMDKYSPFNYPPDQYKFIIVNYSLMNPSDSPVTYEFNISIRDQQNRYFTTDEFVLGETVPPHGNLVNRRKSFAVYRNSTNLQLVWTDKEINPPWTRYDTVFDLDFQDVTPTPAATPTSTPSPTPTPTPAPSGGCLPFLPIGLAIGCMGGLGLMAKKYNNGR